MPVKVGDLVGFYRRKAPGMGIILEKIDNVLEECGVEEYGAFNIAENARGRTYWEKKEAIKDLGGDADTNNTELLRLFFQFNEKWCRKPKKAFVRIKWFRHPGAYESTIREEEGWYPADWVKSK